MKNVFNQLLCGALLSLSIQTPAQADQHALLIGVGDYAFERIEDLEGPVHDVAALQTVLNTHWGFNPANISTLVNEQASERNIKAAFETLLKNTNKGDDVLIYFSGHGTSIKDQDFGVLLNLPHTSGALVTHDFDPRKHMARIESGEPIDADDDGILIGRHEIKPMLEKLSQDRTVFVIFDSCFSGNCLNCKPIGDTPSFDYNNVIYFGAAADNQLAIEHTQAEIDAGLVSTFDGKPHGGFSDALLRVMSNPDLFANNPVNYRQLFNLLVNTFNVNCANCAHNPVLLPGSGSKALTKTVLSKVPEKTTLASLSNPFSFDKNALKPALQIAATNLATPLTKAINLIESVQMNGVSPDISLKQQGDKLEARAADGLLISTLPANAESAVVEKWLAAQAWLKTRKLKDAANNGGNLMANFRNPLTNPVAFAGESVYFTVSLEKEARLVMLLTNSSGELSLLYPLDQQQAEQVFSAPGTIHFPDREDVVLKVTEPWGTDNVAIYALPSDSALGTALLPLAQKPNFDHTEPEITRFSRALDTSTTRYSVAHVRFHATK